MYYTVHTLNGWVAGWGRKHPRKHARAYSNLSKTQLIRKHTHRVIILIIIGGNVASSSDVTKLASYSLLTRFTMPICLLYNSSCKKNSESISAIR